MNNEIKRKAEKLRAALLEATDPRFVFNPEDTLEILNDYLQEREWISVKDNPPKLNTTVLGYCPIYGRAIRYYKEIGDSGWGEWDDVVKGGMGGLPPTHYMELPPEPEQ